MMRLCPRCKKEVHDGSFCHKCGSPLTVSTPRHVKHLVGHDGAPMVHIPPGNFMMGSNDGGKDERPAHMVMISPFQMDMFNVTSDLYEIFCDKTERKKPRNPGWGHGNEPVVNVSWDDALAYATYYDKRLPTEAEWEYACRAGGTGKWCFGNDVERLEKYAWYDANSDNQTHSVGEKKANAWGLYDMHGNVWEWCMDWYDVGYYEISTDRDPVGPVSGHYRVLRGGSWLIDPAWCRSSLRYKGLPGNRTNLVGFRCVSAKAGRIVRSKDGKWSEQK